ncbi:MAG TPA: glutamine-hydrolyzing carbamoyl-phosphate synthase small subunit, partial [Arthrobacter sp.]|nr:glutamine-hydrolyzing carbamoyl-phosphate synthase small subunit [Arthrobacter sp.]
MSATTTPEPAVLVLEDGRVFRGRAYGAGGTALGEAVFATGMTGYQETITDPSYARQLVVQTAPHIGNTGVNQADNESRRIWVAGYIVRDAARRPSNWRSEGTLDDELTRQGVVGIQGVDTRAITRHLRERGAMKAGIFSGAAARATDAELLEQVTAQAPMAGARLAEEVSVDEPYTVEPADHGWTGEPRFSIAAIDLGLKGMTPVRFAERGVRVHVLPAASSFEQITAVQPDGVFLSNGPGDPATADEQVATLRRVLDARIPFFGICFGNQILGRALGFGTYKLPYGHRG